MKYPTSNPGRKKISDSVDELLGKVPICIALYKLQSITLEHTTSAGVFGIEHQQNK